MCPWKKPWVRWKNSSRTAKYDLSGVSNFGVRDLTETHGFAEIVTDQLIYSQLFRAIEYEILQKCRESRVGVLAYSPLAQGLLMGKFKGPDEVKKKIGPNADPWRTTSRIR